jgi:prepilin-type N-terminal cleavage/methylation domain-containing protein
MVNQRRFRGSRSSRTQQGFTLIELLTVIGLLGVLTGLGMANVRSFRQKAYYSVVVQSLRDAFTASSSAFVKDTPPASFGLVSQGSPGAMTDTSARNLLDGYVNPSNTKIQVSYDASCVDAGCTAMFLQVNHCKGSQYAQLIQLGDGTDLRLDRIDGVGCP